MKGWKYEAFHVIHVIMAALVLFGVGLHHTDFGTHSMQAITSLSPYSPPIVHSRGLGYY
jgi:hypothetical protein